MSLITPGLSSYSISLYPELKDLDSMMPDNSQVTQPKITIFSYNSIAGGKSKMLPVFSVLSLIKSIFIW